MQGGGAERVAVTIANALSHRGYEINFVVLNLVDSVHQDILEKEINLVNLRVRHARNSFLPILQFMNKMKPEIVLVFNHELAVLVSILRMLFQKRFILIARNINPLSEIRNHIQSLWHGYFKDVIIKYLYNKSDQIIAQSEAMKKDLVENYRISLDKIVIINNPVAEEFERLRETKICKDNEILYIGRLEEQKGLTYLIHAFKLVGKTEPHLRLRIIGKGSLQNELERYANALGISDRIIFEGYKKNTIPFYQKAKLTVLSSLYEGFPNVLIESIFCGTPVVAFDCKSGPAEIIKEGVNGFLVEYLNTQQLANKIVEGLHHDWDSVAIRNTARHYNSERIIGQYIEVFSKVKSEK